MLRPLYVGGSQRLLVAISSGDVHSCRLGCIVCCDLKLLLCARHTLVFSRNSSHSTCRMVMRLFTSNGAIVLVD